MRPEKQFPARLGRRLRRAWLCFVLAAAVIPVAVSAGGFFVRNAGQLPPDVLYTADVPGGRIVVRRNDLVVQMVESRGNKGKDSRPFKESRPAAVPNRGDAGRPVTPLHVSNVFLTFEGSSWKRVVGEGRLSTRVNIFKGRNPAGWRRDIPTFQNVRVRDFYPGLDLLIDAGPGPCILRIQETDDRAALNRVRLEADTTAEVRWGRNGLSVKSSFSKLKIAYPPVFSGGRRLGVLHCAAGGKVWLASDTPAPVHQVAAEETKDQTQNLQWATYLGGNDDDRCWAVALDSSNNVVVGGWSRSADLPAPGGYDQTFNGVIDCYVAKLSSSGDSLLWATYIGGSAKDKCRALALDASDNVFMGGWSGSADSPVPGGYDTSFNGGFSDCYVAKLSPSGDSLLWATYIGGSDKDQCHSITLDSSGNVLTGGYAASSDCPVPGGYDTTLNGPTDFYIAKLSPSGGSLLWATYLGGGGEEYERSIALDSSDNAVVVGYTSSLDCPVPGGYDTTFNGADDLYIAKVSANGDSLMWATYLGGSGYDDCSAVVLDASNNVFVGGQAQSSDCPVPGGYDTTFNGGDADYYIAELSPSGDSLLWATYLGGSGYDRCYAMALDVSGDVVVAGWTDSADCPTVDAYDATYNGGGGDFYCARLSPSGDSLLKATYLGGTGYDDCRGLAIDGSGGLVLGGRSDSTDCPVPGAYDAINNGNNDYYIAKFDWCVISCAASVPSTGRTGDAVSFSSSADLSGCTGTPAFDWDFGDGSPHSIEQNPSHTYDTAGSYSWIMTATLGSHMCTESGTISINPNLFRYGGVTQLIPQDPANADIFVQHYPDDPALDPSRDAEGDGFGSGDSFPHETTDLQSGSPPLVFYELSGSSADTLRVTTDNGKVVINY